MDTLFSICFYAILGMIAFAVFKAATTYDGRKQSEANSKKDDDDDLRFFMMDDDDF